MEISVLDDQMKSLLEEVLIKMIREQREVFHDIFVVTPNHYAAFKRIETTSHRIKITMSIRLPPIPMPRSSGLKLPRYLRRRIVHSGPQYLCRVQAD